MKRALLRPHPRSPFEASMPRARLNRLSLQWKLPLLLGALLVVVITALCGAAYYAVRQSTEYSATGRLHEVNSQLVDLLKLQVQVLQKRALASADKPEVAAYLKRRGARESEALRNALKIPPSDSQVVAIQLLSPNGGELFAMGPSASLVADQPDPTDLPGHDGSADSASVGRLLARGDT